MDEDDDDIFLTPNDVEHLDGIEPPALRDVAKKHLVIYNNEVTNKISLLKSQQERHAPSYIYILTSTYELIKQHLSETPPEQRFAVIIKGTQTTTDRPTIATWLQFNRAKGDALGLIVREMKESGREVAFVLSEVFYVESDRYYSGGEKLTMYEK